MKILSNKRRLSQMCLVGAMILNAIVLLMNLRISNLDGELKYLQEKERYFITNTGKAKIEKNFRIFLHNDLNSLKLLRRLAIKIIPPAENQNLLKEQKIMQRDIDASLRKFAARKYLLAYDPPSGTNVDSIFANMTEEQIRESLPTMEADIWKDARGFKTEMIRLLDEIPLWSRAHHSFLILSTILIIVANFIIYTSKEERSP